MAAGHDAADCRLDVWLWAARFFRTRSLAKDAILGGKVVINGQGAKPARAVRIGDRIEVQRAGERFDLKVAALGEQRASAAVAASMYVEAPESVAARLALREQKRFEALGMQPPDGKPDKRARRLLRALGDFDAT